MKTINRAFFLCSIIAAMLLCGAAYKTGDKVDLIMTVEEELVYNNSVGNDWDNWYSVRYRGEKYYCDPGESITIPYYIGDEIEIHSYVEEADSYPDITYYSNWDSFSAEEATEGVSRGWVHTLTVRENRGSYIGNTAQWEVTFRFSIAAEKPASTPSLLPKTNVYWAAEETENTPTSTPQPSPLSMTKKNQVDAEFAEKDAGEISWTLVALYIIAAGIAVAVIVRIVQLFKYCISGKK